MIPHGLPLAACSRLPAPRTDQDLAKEGRLPGGRVGAYGSPPRDQRPLKKARLNEGGQAGPAATPSSASGTGGGAVTPGAAPGGAAGGAKAALGAAASSSPAVEAAAAAVAPQARPRELTIGSAGGEFQGWAFPHGVRACTVCLAPNVCGQGFNLRGFSRRNSLVLSLEPTASHVCAPPLPKKTSDSLRLPVLPCRLLAARVRPPKAGARAATVRGRQQRR